MILKRPSQNSYMSKRDQRSNAETPFSRTMGDRSSNSAMQMSGTGDDDDDEEDDQLDEAGGYFDLSVKQKGQLKNASFNRTQRLPQLELPTTNKLIKVDSNNSLHATESYQAHRTKNLIVKTFDIKDKKLKKKKIKGLPYLDQASYLKYDKSKYHAFKNRNKARSI